MQKILKGNTPLALLQTFFSKNDKILFLNPTARYAIIGIEKE